MLSRQCRRCTATLAAATRSRIHGEGIQYRGSERRFVQSVHRGTLSSASFTTSAQLYKRKVAQDDIEEIDEAEEEDFGIDEKMISAMTPIVETSENRTETTITESFNSLRSSLEDCLTKVENFKANRPRDATLVKLVEAISQPEHADALLPIIKLWHSRQLPAMSSNARHLFILKTAEAKRPQVSAEVFLDPAQYGIHPRIEDVRLVVAEVGKTIKPGTSEEVDIATLDLMYTLLASLPYYSLPERDPFIYGSLLSACKLTGGEEAISRAIETTQELKDLLTDDLVEAIKSGTKHGAVHISRRRIEQDRQKLIEGLSNAAEIVDNDLAKWCKATSQRLVPVPSSAS